eukprot:scaffold216072_cov26-Prasinocladus_malaysianus.AAC.1
MTLIANNANMITFFILGRRCHDCRVQSDNPREGGAQAAEADGRGAPGLLGPHGCGQLRSNLPGRAALSGGNIQPDGHTRPRRPPAWGRGVAACQRDCKQRPQ